MTALETVLRIARQVLEEITVNEHPDSSNYYCVCLHKDEVNELREAMEKL
jgi:hypothetical protein